MITEKELLIANESPTKKDLYQIYPEILELVTKITERWDPSTSNESDPGVVLLKLLAFMADKHNYNIDKNVLECFMPSCTQEDSMRKLCDMMGYEMKYIQSATTTVTMMFQGTELDEGNKYLWIPEHTAITNVDNDVTYITLEEVNIGEKYEQKTVECIEGEFVECEINDSNLIKLYNLDDNFRFYLPENQIAENGIFVESIDDTANGSTEDVKWEKVNNLNTQRAGKYVWKFGYDSKKQLPYIQFPEDIGTLIGAGLKISYVRSKGVNGNISASTLVKFSGDTKYLYDISTNETTEISLTEENFVIKNVSATENGRDKEDIDSAYNNFKKIIGTFDTLVTCRDYANAIYNLVSSKDNTTPLVSNVQVSDIRDDLNRSYALLTYDSNGLIIKEEAKYDEKGDPEINHFDLYFYTFKPIVGEYTKTSYKGSFAFNGSNLSEIKKDLEDAKTISHSIKEPAYTDVVAIKNYYDLKAKITTTHKVNTIEENNILNAIYKALYQNFNMRKIDWGEEIPFDSILSVIQNADSRIKNVALEEPEIVTAFLRKSGQELRSDATGSEERSKYLDEYEKTVLKNVLAGRVPLLRYEDEFLNELGETVSGIKDPATPSKLRYEDIYYGNGLVDNNSFKYIQTEARLPVSESGTELTLEDNEVIQFIAPNYTTTITYPSYVNYNFKSPSHKTEGKPVDAGTEYKLLDDDVLYINYTDSNENVYNIKYTKDKIIKYTNGVEAVEDAPEVGNIIKPNFDLYDSEALKARSGSLKKWAKTSGYNFGAKETKTLSGMFSLGTSEQIEIRDHVKSKLTSTWKCYWLVDGGEIIFDENTSEYVLQEGEYFFYTNDAMTELVTLGSGTKLYNPKGIEFKLPDSEDVVDVEDIASKGIAAFDSSVWVIKRFTEEKYLEIQEMQILTLTNGDTLKTLVGLDETIFELRNGWKKVKSAAWNYADGTSGRLPELAVGTDYWQVRSRLDLNVGPLTIQKLNSRDYIHGLVDNKSAEWWIEFNGGEDASTGLSTPLYIKSNYLLQKTGGEHINVSITIAKSDGTYAETDNLIIKAFDYEEPSGESAEESGAIIPFTLNDYETYFTKLSFKKYKSVGLNCLIKARGDTTTKSTPYQYGTLMLYYVCSLIDTKESGEVKQGATIKLVDAETKSTEIEGLRFLNQRDPGGNLVDPVSKLTLNLNPDGMSTEIDNERINVIQITKPGTLIIECNDDAQGNIILGQLELVTEKPFTSGNTSDMGVNTELLDIEPDRANSFMRQIWDADVDHIFYYTGAPIDNTSCIDLNVDAGEKLSDAIMWYDYNNICNKFVISELDADKFGTGITLTKSSRLS